MLLLSTFWWELGLVLELLFLYNWWHDIKPRRFLSDETYKTFSNVFDSEDDARHVVDDSSYRGHGLIDVDFQSGVWCELPPNDFSALALRVVQISSSIISAGKDDSPKFWFRFLAKGQNDLLPLGHVSTLLLIRYLELFFESKMTVFWRWLFPYCQVVMKFLALKSWNWFRYK